MSSARLPDAAARERAAADFDVNLVVEAGAGTGKTSLLIERLLTALGGGLVEVTGLAAITFTEKAAGEMRERLAGGLEELRRAASGEAAADPGNASGRAFLRLAGPDPGTGGRPVPEIASRALAALADLDRARVATIHSFCADLLRSFPVEAGVDPDFQVDHGAHLAALLDAGWEEFLQCELGPEAPRPELWRRLLARLTPSEICALARGRGGAGGLAGFTIPGELLERPYRAADARLLFGPEAAGLRDRLERLLADEEKVPAVAGRRLAGYAELLGLLAGGGAAALQTRLAADPDLAEVLECPLPQPGKWLRSLEPAEFRRLVRQAAELAGCLAGADEALLADLVEAVQPFARQARRRLLARGMVDFDALLALARDLLRDHPAVREQVRRRYRMLLVDEFQDTDPLQYEIVLFLAGRPGESAADAYQVPLAPGRLFIVGDPKQSIYRFRGADYAAFRRAVARVLEQGGVKLDLTANFRSRPGVLAPINRLFEPSAVPAWIESPYQPAYLPIDAAREADSGPRPPVELWTLELPEGIAAAERRTAEGRLVAAEIAALTGSSRFRRSEILILLRAFTDLARYLRPLREAGIPFVVDGGKEFLARGEVAELLAVLRALTRPSDPAALLAYLRSPAGAVPDTELADYARAGGVWHFARAAAPAAFPNIARAFGRLRELALETIDLPADAVVRRVLDHSLLVPLSAFAFEGPQRVANLRKLVAAAGDLTRDGRLSLTEVLDALEAERAMDVEGDSPLADERTDAVRVLTIHKAKGLESPVVILPDLARGENARTEGGEQVDLARLPDGSEALALRAGTAAGAARIWWEREERRHQEAEGRRLLYVALTRARERLIVIAGPARRASPWVEALAAWGYRPAEAGPLAAGAEQLVAGGLVVHRHLAPADLPPPQPLPEPPGRAAEVAAYGSAWLALAGRARPPIQRPSGLKEELDARRAAGEEEAQRPPADGGRALGQATGVLLHGLLEHWDESGAAGRRAALPATAAGVAGQLGLDPAVLERAGSEVLEAFLASPLATRLAGLELLGRELPLLLADEDGATWAGSIDLLAREPGGRLVVIDYKTDREAVSVIERYAGQLGIYVRAVQKAFGLAEPPAAELWLLRTGQALPIPS